MDIITVLPEVGIIALFCMIVGQAVKTIPGFKGALIPFAVVIAGIGFALLGRTIGVADLAGLDVFTTIGAGIVSAIASSGLYSYWEAFNKAVTDSLAASQSKDDDA